MRLDTDPFERTDKPVYHITLWPNRSLTAVGFRNTMILVVVGTCIGITPLVMATSNFWMLLFAIVPVVTLYLFFLQSYRDGRLTEELRIYSDVIAVERRESSGEIHRWHANPYWVKVKLQDKHVENYLTLEGNQRTVELGAFLSPEERLKIKVEIDDVLRGLDINA
ncbi:MAG: DUF2244 domain-containing protein [Rhodobacteraceae bacterium]|nr:DUF2244 domain-containing protein [Paracoccaceae bacterium]